MISTDKPAAAGPHRASPVAIVACVWLVSALPFVLGVVRCPMAQLFHTSCPGCGMSRAFHLLFEGFWAASWAMHPLAVPTALVQGLFAIATVLETSRTGVPWTLLQRRTGRVIVGIAGIVLVLDVALWIARSAGAFGGPVPVG